jgi:hypothetical protein
MNYRSHRHDDCCESPEPYCQPPISWPQRPSLPNFPGIATFWPMPFALPMLPSMGPWGGMGAGCERPYYSHRRHDMYLYRCCEPRYGRHAQCCERCGEYDCRCGRRCERCGEYDCRCERRCERCGRRDCQCGRHRGCLIIKLRVLPVDKYNFAISIDPDCLDCDVQPVVKPLHGDSTGTTIPAPLVQTYQDTVEIAVTLAKPPAPDYYTGSVYDRRYPNNDPIATLKLRIF